MILILAGQRDPHVTAVQAALDALGAPHALLDASRLPLTGRIEDRCDDGGVQCIMDGAQTLSLDRVTAIWARRPQVPQVDASLAPAVAEFVRRETGYWLEGALRSTDALWVNDPASSDRAALKHAQLRLARALGFSIPVTLVTNDPAAARRFIAECAPVIVKLVDSRSAFALEGLPLGWLGTVRLTTAEEALLDQVSAGAHLFQAEVPKALDLRVTVVGQRWFAVEIHSQEGTGREDWRRDYTVPQFPHALPEDVAARCLRLVAAMGLLYGAIDLVLTPAGKYVFLEVNPEGQYYWMEELLDLPISRTLAKLLAGIPASGARG